jgi:hypothetical protein
MGSGGACRCAGSIRRSEWAVCARGARPAADPGRACARRGPGRSGRADAGRGRGRRRRSGCSGSGTPPPPSPAPRPTLRASSRRGSGRRRRQTAAALARPSDRGGSRARRARGARCNRRPAWKTALAHRGRPGRPPFGCQSWGPWMPAVAWDERTRAEVGQAFEAQLQSI